MGATAMRRGGVHITNDAWMGTGHMSDVCVLKPIFRGGRLVAFSATTSHMPDIGGGGPAPPTAGGVGEGGPHPLFEQVGRGGAGEDPFGEGPRHRAPPR